MEIAWEPSLSFVSRLTTEYTEGEHRFSWGLFLCVLSVPWFQWLSDETTFVVWKSLEEFETQRHRGHGEKKDREEGERRRGEEKGRGEGEGEATV
jgi:hypothetical protein